MKKVPYLFLVTFFLLLQACSEEDETTPQSINIEQDSINIQKRDYRLTVAQEGRLIPLTSYTEKDSKRKITYYGDYTSNGELSHMSAFSVEEKTHSPYFITFDINKNLNSMFEVTENGTIANLHKIATVEETSIIEYDGEVTEVNFNSFYDYKISQNENISGIKNNLIRQTLTQNRIALSNIFQLASIDPEGNYSENYRQKKFVIEATLIGVGVGLILHKIIHGKLINKITKNTVLESNSVEELLVKTCDEAGSYFNNRSRKNSSYSCVASEKTFDDIKKITEEESDICNLISHPSCGVVDCHGDWVGTAYLDECDVCVGGNTGVVANSTCEEENKPNVWVAYERSGVELGGWSTDWSDTNYDGTEVCVGGQIQLISHTLTFNTDGSVDSYMVSNERSKPNGIACSTLPFEDDETFPKTNHWPSYSSLVVPENDWQNDYYYLYDESGLSRGKIEVNSQGELIYQRTTFKKKD